MLYLFINLLYIFSIKAVFFRAISMFILNINEKLNFCIMVFSITTFKYLYQTLFYLIYRPTLLAN